MIKIQRKTSKIIFIFILCLLSSSCVSQKVVKLNWPDPKQPIRNEVVFTPIAYNGQRGVFVNEQDVIDLANNTKEQQRYVKDLEALIQSIKTYYKAN